MKTIEERATDYANNNPHGNPYNWNAHHDAYVDAATEQKAIDIDKACVWLSHRFIPYEGFSFGHLEKSFRKAMEE